MNKRNLRTALHVLSITVAVSLVSACGDSGSVDTPAGAATVASNSEFTFPKVNQSNDGDTVDIPANAALPGFSARRKISSGSGAAIEFGDPVVIKYDMYSWSTGEKVESSEDIEEAITVQAGVVQGIPEYLATSLLGRQIGDKLEIVFQHNMDDLPSYLDKNDAYVLVVEIL